MVTDSQVKEAIERGTREGLAALEPVQRVVFLISEAEVYCDMEGVDSLVERYGIARMSDFAEAFQAIGAVQIAGAFADLASGISEQKLSAANELVTSRSGYSYENIKHYVANAV